MNKRLHNCARFSVNVSSRFTVQVLQIFCCELSDKAHWGNYAAVYFAVVNFNFKFVFTTHTLKNLSILLRLILFLASSL